MEIFNEMHYDSVDIAKALLWKAQQCGKEMTITKLHKILYITYGLFLANFGSRLVDEHPKAWPYGPVFPRVNKKVKVSESVSDSEYSELPKEIQLGIDKAVTTFGDWSAVRLTEWSHDPIGPWALTRKLDDSKWGSIIDDRLIYVYFQQFCQKQTQ